MPPRPAFLLLSTLAAALSAFPLRADDDPLDALPAETGVLLRLAAPTDLSAKSKAFLRNAAPQLAQVADQLGPGLGSLIGNPTLAGIDPARPWYVAALPRPAGPPAVLFAVPASDAAALKKAVGQGYTFADHEKWVLYSLDAEALKKVQSRIDGEGKPVRDALGGSVGDVFGKGEVAAFLNVPVLREAYKPQIDEARKQLASLSEAAATANPAAKAGMEYNRQALDMLLKAVGDMTGIAANLSIAEQSLDEETVVAVAADSPTAAFLAKQTPSDFPLLAKLPRGRVSYYALAGNLSELIAASTRMTSGLYPQNEELGKRMQDLATFKSGEIVGLLELGDLEAGVYRGVTIARIDAPERYLSLAREMVKAMGHAETPGLQQDVTLRPEAETIDDVKVDVVKIVMTPGPNADPAGTSGKFLEVFFGKDGMTQRMAVVDGLFVQAVGGADAMKTAIEAVKGQAAGDEAAAKAVDSARAGLGKANVLALVDLPRLLAGGFKLAVQSNELPIPIDAKAIEDLDFPPSYAAATVAAGTNEARVRISIPAAQVRGTVDLLLRLQQAGAGRNRAQ